MFKIDGCHRKQFAINTSRSKFSEQREGIDRAKLIQQEYVRFNSYSIGPTLRDFIPELYDDYLLSGVAEKDQALTTIGLTERYTQCTDRRGWYLCTTSLTKM